MNRLLSSSTSVCLLLLSCSGDPGGVADNDRPQESRQAPWPDPSSPDGGAGAAGSDAGLPILPVPPTAVPAPNLTIREIAVFQAVKVTIFEDGEEVDPSSTVHVVAGREGIVRVYVEPSAQWTPREVTAELSLVRNGLVQTTLESTRYVAEASTESDLDSTLNIDIPANLIETDTHYRLRLLVSPDQAAGDSSGAVFPPSGEAPLRAWDTGPSLKVMLVPVRVNGRVPDTSDEQLELYRDELHAMFPARTIELSVRSVYDYSGGISAGGGGISSLLGAVTNLRQKDGAPDDEYYYGAFRPTDTYSQYCQGGCTTGLCHLVSSSSDTYSRACVGVGFKGPSAAGTMAHELGHAHGLPHAPCGGPAGPDPNYPYYNAKIGSWGLDLRDGSLIEPTVRDFMSYCNPSFISDYNYDRLIHRMTKVLLAERQRASAPPEPASEWLTAEVDAAGNISWGQSITLRRAPLGEPRTVVFELGGVDRERSVARFYPFADLPGGTLLIPKRRAAWDAVRVSDLGGRQSVRRAR